MMCIMANIVGCSDRDKIQELQADITLPSGDQEIWIGDVVYFKGVGTGGTPPYSYHWDFGKTMPKSLQPNTGQVTFNYEGAYRVVFMVKDSTGKEATDSVRIIVNPKS